MIPGFLISLLTFPGVMVHELAHLLFCRWFGVPVMKVCYFRFGSPAGYVIHGEPHSAGQHILISIGPFFVNTLLGALIALPAVLTVTRVSESELWQGIFAWLGVSIAMHAFPSTGDARSLWQGLWRAGVPWGARLLAIPIVGLIYLGAAGAILWLDLLYGVAVALLLPRMALY